MKRFILLLLFYNLLLSQYYYFGRNKVQYKKFNFREMEGEHFKVLYYQGGKILAEFALNVLESTYRDYTKDFGREIDFKIPVIVYNSPGDFSQTNVILSLIEEGTGGFTEIFKNRIVVPFNGSYREFIHVLKHELVHVFEFQIFRDVFSDVFSLAPYEPPLWVTEGLAEFCSSHGREDYYPFMEDLLLNDNLLSLDDLSHVYGYIVYKQGESFFLFIEEKYGRRKVFEFVNALRYRKSVKGSIRAVFGVKEEDFEEEYRDYLKLKFWRGIEKKDFYHKNVEVLHKHGREIGIYNYSPSVSPDGSKIAYVSDREGYLNLYIISAYDGSIIRKLIKGERGSTYEDIPMLRKVVTWIDKDRIGLVIHKSGKDRVYIVSYPEGEILEVYKGFDLIEDLSGLNGSLLFVGVRDGRSDIYMIRDGRVHRLTYDIYEDRNPVFLSSDTFIFFSDRGKDYRPGVYSLYMGVIKEGYAEVYPLFESVGVVHSLAVDRKRRRIWVVRGVERIVSCYGLEGEHLGDIALPGGVYTLDYSSEKDFLVFSHFNNFGWDIALVKHPVDRLRYVEISDYTPYPYEEVVNEYSDSRYTLSFSIDYIYGGMSYSSLFGMSAGLSLAFSDLLGNHRFYMFTNTSSDIERATFYFTYLYLERRVDLGFSLFQFLDYYYVENDTYLERRWRGGGLSVIYPFSKFSRFEVNPLLFFIRDVYFNGMTGIVYDIDEYSEAYMDFALVKDNTLFYMYSPFTGVRWRTEFYFPSTFNFYSGYLDLRRYLMLFYPQYSFATRLVVGGSYGEEPERFYIGGIYGVRGFESDSLVTGQYVAFTNLELRVPLIEEVRFGFPRFSLHNIRGAFFLDAGITQDGLDRLYYERVMLSLGLGIRWVILYFPINIDFAYPVYGGEDGVWRVYISFYPEF